MLALQRQAGNRAVTGLLTRADTRMPSPLLVQRAPAKLTFSDLALGTNAAGRAGQGQTGAG